MKADVRDSLLAILERDGEITVSAVLAEAKNENSPLHREFEWNQEKAAQRYLEIQARNLIKRVNVSIERDEEKLVHVPSVTYRSEGAYRPVGAVIQSMSEFERAMSQATGKLKAAHRDVELLERMAAKAGDEDKSAILAVALQGLSTAQTALERLH